MVKAIIFDLDGTLIDTDAIAHHSAQKAFLTIGYTLTNSDLKWLVARHPKDFVPHLLTEHQLDISKSDEIVKSFRTNYHLLWDNDVSLKPGAKEVCLALIQKGINLSLATTSSNLTVEKFIDKFGFKNIFTNITTSDEVTKLKPDPEPYLVAKNKLPFDTEEILVVEDSHAGLLSAKGAGLTVAVIPSEFTKDQDHSIADHFLENLEDVLNLIE